MKEKEISREFLEALEGYRWPGNVREPINLVDSALALEPGCPAPYPLRLPEYIRPSTLGGERRAPLPGSPREALRRRPGQGLRPVRNTAGEDVPVARQARRAEARKLDRDQPWTVVRKDLPGEAGAGFRTPFAGSRPATGGGRHSLEEKGFRRRKNGRALKGNGLRGKNEK